MPERIGILVGMEESFPAAFVESVNRQPGFHAELAKLGGIRETYEPPYGVLVDRISHEVPFYRLALKAAALAGTYVINDPFWWSADDKFFGFSLAQRIGVRVPRTVLLPSKSYIPAIDPARSLRNLEYPLDWEGIARYVGFPAVLKPATGGGWKGVSRVNDMHELWRDYDQSGQDVMTLQEYIEFDEYVRCICIGREDILPIQYDPRGRRYIEHAGSFLPAALEKQILDGAHALNDALGYDMNSVEFACKDGVPYAIDFTNPAPDMHRESVLPKHFDWCVDRMTALVVAAARGHKKNDHRYAFTRRVR
jgi:glutathione synthase/RimK-type ligase-like ATP-grasp enzyme